MHITWEIVWKAFPRPQWKLYGFNKATQLVLCNINKHLFAEGGYYPDTLRIMVHAYYFRKQKINVTSSSAI